MRRRRSPLRPTGRTLPALFVAFVLGFAAGWWIHSTTSSRSAPAGAPAAANAAPRITPSPTASPPVAAPAPSSDAHDTDREHIAATTGVNNGSFDPISELRRHALRLPLDAAGIDAMKGGFDQPRLGEPRGHEAVDLLAARETPVHAVEDGKIARLFFSKAGGITIYQFDPSGQFCYYYAHLDHYASGLHDGQFVAKGDVLGYVGTSGNAPENTPHLHFAILKLGSDRRWWKGTAIDPYLVYKR